MKKSLQFVANAVLRGFLIVVPVYLALLLLLKAMGEVAKLVRPFTVLVPDWFPAERLFSLLLLLCLCFLMGVVVRTRAGEVMAKELRRRTAKSIELKSLNAEHADRTLAASDVLWIARILWASQ